ncbi:unnamed protein product [Caenorhabditis angaria]|uniref:Uncharacterized protein n=1 Tax=Caenorhabditis angaria TaxID=860376 RepID=A0A9P1N867_9PELO|nr:unnamed protein product [Caenorhabditis angaria]
MSEPSNFEMSLLNVIINGYTLNQKYYNCSDPRGLQGLKVQQNFFGWYFLVTGIIFVSLYIPCIISGLKSDLMNTSCYKIMLCLSVFDILSLITNSIATGFYCLKASNFCDYPKSIFFFGSLGCGAWLGGCLSCVMLAINRCCDLNPHLKLRWIFVGRRTYFTIAAIVVYASYAMFLTKPPLFSSQYMTWFFNPMISTNPLWYINLLHTTNNCVVSICTTSLYTYLCILLIHKSRHASSEAVSRTQRQVFLQSVIICSFNAIAAYIYVYMQYFYSPPIIMLIGQIAWQFSNGSVCIVYLTMNRTIRKGVYEMLVPKRIREKARVTVNATYSNKSAPRAMTSSHETVF